MHSRARLFAITLGVVAGLLGAVAPADASDGTVRPGQSIQKAIDHARPGDTIAVAPGVFRENLTITTNGITLRGAGSGRRGTVLMAASTPTPTPCTVAPSTEVHGICVLGASGSPIRDVTIKDLIVDGFSGSGIFALDAEDYTVARVHARNNHEYGIAGFVLSRVRYLDSLATSNAAPGIYIGDSHDAQALVMGNTSISNGVGGEGFGFLFRDSSNGRVTGNRATGNCVGFYFLDHRFNPVEPLSDWTAEGNTATGNNGVCPEAPNFPAFSGIGILLGGTHAVHVTRNVVLGNRSNDSQLAGGIVVASTVSLGGANPTDNVVSRNAALLNRPDIRWDGTGSGNRFKHNICAVSIPSSICR
jgi:nitrous oxidase accessory protein NosD